MKVNTGWTSIDQKVGGLKPGTISCIIGHTFSGKTSSLINVSNSVLKDNFYVLFVTTEESANSIEHKIYNPLTISGGSDITVLPVAIGSDVTVIESYIIDEMKSVFTGHEQHVPVLLVDNVHLLNACAECNRNENEYEIISKLKQLAIDYHGVVIVSGYPDILTTTQPIFDYTFQLSEPGAEPVFIV